MLRGIARFSVAFSTIALRLASFIYLRWIPSHVLWPAIIFFWLQFILSFILILYLDLEPPEPIVNVETIDVVEVISNGADKPAIIEMEMDTVTVEPPKPTMTTTISIRPVSWMET